MNSETERTLTGAEKNNRELKLKANRVMALALIPGLGQVYSGRIARGLTIFGFMASVFALIMWRLTAHGVINFSGPAAQGPDQSEINAVLGLTIFLSLCSLVIYIWSILDARGIALGKPRKVTSVILVGMVVYCAIGWDVTQIDFGKALRDLPILEKEIVPVAWPFSDVFEYGAVRTEAVAYVDVPCGNNPAPDEPAEVSGQPFISVTPTCGDEAGAVQPDGSRNPPVGTALHIVGHGFRPNQEATLWWQPTASDEFWPQGKRLTATADAQGNFSLDITIPYFSLTGASQVRNTVKMRQETQTNELHFTEDFNLASSKMAETVFLALMATLFGMIFALPLSFLAARNLMSGSGITLVIYQIVRTIFNFGRSIEALLVATIFAAWVGLGPFAGTLAIGFHTIVVLGKLYSEGIEDIQPGPIEAIRATGANWLQVIVYGIVPQIIPSFVSFTLYRWDVNVRFSTIIGFVGGGGIGFIFLQFIHQSNFYATGICVWLIAFVVTALDYASAQIRQKFV
ncbi:MAG TPA: phosphonate ABC transporter, permease protein PhnE [Aggregatilineales bacterium]|nr:phosphonate ABC transporter, permease protein PhnE [Aggregatilineales bacterium]